VYLFVFAVVLMFIIIIIIIIIILWCFFLDFFTCLIYMGGKRDPPNQAGVFTRGEGIREFVMTTKWLNTI
jgi:hypothetical protein